MRSRFGGRFPPSRFARTGSNLPNGPPVRQKAQLSPLGDVFYQDVYSFLSRVAHQDFETVANYAHTLERSKRPEFDDDTLLTLLRFADLIVAKVVTRILDDVGKTAVNDQWSPASQPPTV
jgi:hypothetical protein